MGKLTEQQILDKCRLFENTGGKIVITSLGIAKDMGVPHFKVMQNCRGWLNKGKSTLQVSTYIDRKGEERPYYGLNKEQLIIYYNHCKRSTIENKLKLKNILDEVIIIDNRKEEEFGYKLLNTLKPLNISIETQKTMEGNNYRIDFYLPEFNLAIEYDEEHHFQEDNIVKDKQRKEEIKKILHCEFIRLDCKNDDNYNIGLILKKIFNR